MENPVQIVCPRCGTINRVPGARLDDAPKCARCHEPLFAGHPIELEGGNFSRHLEKTEIPIVVDFWAPWCGPCQQMAPQYAEAARELEPKVRLAKLNTEAVPELANRFGIRGIPTMIMFKAGREVARQTGAMGKSDIIRWVRGHV